MPLYFKNIPSFYIALSPSVSSSIMGDERGGRGGEKRKERETITVNTHIEKIS
jgi:hypothetical protein